MVVCYTGYGNMSAISCAGKLCVILGNGKIVCYTEHL